MLAVFGSQLKTTAIPLVLGSPQDIATQISTLISTGRVNKAYELCKLALEQNISLSPENPKVVETTICGLVPGTDMQYNLCKLAVERDYDLDLQIVETVICDFNNKEKDKKQYVLCKLALEMDYDLDPRIVTCNIMDFPDNSDEAYTLCRLALEKKINVSRETVEVIIVHTATNTPEGLTKKFALIRLALQSQFKYRLKSGTLKTFKQELESKLSKQHPAVDELVKLARSHSYTI